MRPIELGKWLLWRLADVYAWFAELEQKRRRWICRRFGHVIRHLDAGVIAFPWCRRCGKYGKQVVHGDLIS